MSEITAVRTVPPTRSPRRTRPLTALVGVLLLGVVLAGCLSPAEKTFLDRTNALRSSNHVRTLQEHGTLSAKAQDWARHMAATGRLEHSNVTSGLDGLRWTALGENVGMSSPTKDTLLSIHNMFVRSAPHRANLLNSNFTHMGVGVATDRYGRVWVAEVFARL